MPRSENFTATALFHKLRPLERQIGCDGFASFSPDRHKTCLVAFSGYSHNALFEVEVLESGSCQLGDAEATGIKQLNDGTIAQAVESFRVDVFEKLFHLQFVEGFREVPFDPGKRQRVSRIASNQSSPSQKPKKNLQRNHNQFDRRGRKAGAFAFPKIFADRCQSHSTRAIDLFISGTPMREFAQRSFGGELIVRRKAALDCKETDKRVDRVFHEAQCSGSHLLCQTR